MYMPRAAHGKMAVYLVASVTAPLLSVVVCCDCDCVERSILELVVDDIPGWSGVTANEFYYKTL